MTQAQSIRRAAITVALLCAVLGILQRILAPKYTGTMVEGAFTGEYYRQDRRDYDVLFIGDCEVYENISPVVLWNEYGIHSYIRGSAQQYIWQSYYLLRDALRDHTPKVVVFNVQALQYDTAQREAYNRMTLDGMRWSADKVAAINASMTEDEQLIEYVFPLLRFHSRWQELTADDVRYAFEKTPTVTYHGYYLRTQSQPAQDFPEGKPLADYAFGEKAWEYLDAIRTLCADNDITLLLIKAPSLYPYWYPEWEEQVVSYAKENELTYLNYYDRLGETGIDYDTDTSDGGLHMNVFGATKLSRDLAPWLLAAGATDRRGEAELGALWQEETARYDAQIDAARAQSKND